jgi:ankyrin repeat protein
MRLTPEQTENLREAYSYLTNFDGDDPTAPIDPASYRTPDGDRLIHIAAGRGDLATVELLLAAGEDVNSIGDMGLTPAHYAAGSQHRELLDLLFERGADATSVDEFGQTPDQKWEFTAGEKGGPERSG